MFTRHLFAAAAMMAATFSAQADVIPAAPDALASSTATASGNVEYYLTRGVEGLYMVNARLLETTPDAADTDTGATAPVVSLPVIVDADTPAPSETALPVGIELPVANAEGDVPEPSSIALMLAGVLGAAGFTRARKQG